MKHNHPASIPRTDKPTAAGAGLAWAALVDEKAGTAGAAAVADAELSLELDQSAGYTADHAALAFGIPRIAPVPTGPDRTSEATAAPSESSRRFETSRDAGEDTGEDAGEIGPEVEDLTESLTADEREVAAPPSSTDDSETEQREDRLGSGSAASGGAGPGPLGELVTAVLTMPKSRPAWCRTERLPLSARASAAATLSGLRVAAAPSPVAVGREPAEAKTTTVTLPVASQPPPGMFAWRELAWRGLLFIAGAAAMGTVLLAARALPIAQGPAHPARLLAPPSQREPSRERPHEPLRDQLIGHALRAIAAGHREQAVALLGRYKESGPPDEHAVDLMLQALKKDLAATPPGR